MKKYLSLALLTVLLSSCVTTSLEYQVSESSKASHARNVSVGKFEYIPYLNGEVNENEFQRTPISIGRVSIDTKVSEFIEGAIKKELISRGYFEDENEPIAINGKILRFYYDWTGIYKFDVEVSLNFNVSQNGSLIYEKTTSSKLSYIDVLGITHGEKKAISDATKNCILEFIKDASEKGVF